MYVLLKQQTNLWGRCDWHLPHRIRQMRLKRNKCFSLTLSFLFSLFCSVEKPPHAHRDQLFHSESLLRWCAGHHHLPACQSGGGHHRDLVLRQHALQNCALFAGMRSFWHRNLLRCSLTHPCSHMCLSLSIAVRWRIRIYIVSNHILMRDGLCEVCPCGAVFMLFALFNLLLLYYP